MLKLNTFEIKNLSQPTQTLLVVWSAAEIENFLNKLLLCIKELDELLVCLSAIFPSENKTMDLKLIYKYKHLPFNIFFQIAAFSKNGLYIRKCCYLKKYIKWSMLLFHNRGTQRFPGKIFFLIQSKISWCILNE